MNLSRAKMEVGFAVESFKSNYKNNKSKEAIQRSWEYLLAILENRNSPKRNIESPDSGKERQPCGENNTSSLKFPDYLEIRDEVITSHIGKLSDREGQIVSRVRDIIKRKLSGS